MINQISVVIISRNAENTIERALQSTASFSEVILYDNGSIDSTLSKASKFENVKVCKGDFYGFGQTKNIAASLSSNDWVLSLDADEELTEALIGELEEWTPSCDLAVYELKRDNYCMGECVNYAGWGNDFLVRLYNRKFHKFREVRVHETIELNSKSVMRRLNYSIIHHAVEDLGDFLIKVNRYSSLKNDGQVKILPPSIILLRSGLAFLKSYILKGGFRAGWRGAVIAYSNATGVFFKYMKAHAKKCMGSLTKLSS